MRRSALAFVLLWAGLALPAHAQTTPPQFPGAPPPSTQVQGCLDPTFGGKYAGELKRLPVPDDRGQYGACNDYGEWTGDSYAGHANLPKGYWVYSYPDWIIFANTTAPKQ